MEQEELLGLMGQWGRFHSRLIAVLSLPIIQNGFQSLMVVVTLAVPMHRCRIPGLHNDTFEIQSESHRHLLESSIPFTRTDDDGQTTYDKCRMYVNGSTYDVISNSTSHAYLNVTPFQGPTVECQSWVYDQSEFESTVITYFDLVCNRKEFRAHINMAYILGLLIGSPLSGFLCDTIGRKRCLFLAVLVNAVVGVLSVFPVLPEVFLVYRMLRGASGITIYMATFVLLLEMAGAEKRNTMGSLVAMVWTMGPLLVGALSYVLPNWRYLQMVSAVPSVLTLLTWRLVPESPRWLLFKGRVAPAVQVVRQAARVNGTALPPEDVDIKDLTADTQEVLTASQSVRQVIRYPRLVVRTLIIFFNWCMVSMTYFGLSLNVANLGGSVRLNFLMSTGVEMVGYLCAWVLLDRLGRKRTHASAMILAGLLCLATIFPGLFMGSGKAWVTTALAMGGKLGISAAFASLYLVSAELFPTVIRNFAIGCASTAGRVGGVTSPYIADLALYVEGSFGRVLPLIIFGGMAVAAGLLSLLLPETLGRQLPDTVQEAAHFGKARKITNTEGTEMTERHNVKNALPLLEKEDHHQE